MPRLRSTRLKYSKDLEVSFLKEVVNAHANLAGHGKQAIQFGKVAKDENTEKLFVKLLIRRIA